MRKLFLTITLFAFAVIPAIAQDVTGKWKTIDDETGEAKSIVEIYKENGMIIIGLPARPKRHFAPAALPTRSTLPRTLPPVPMIAQ